VDWRHGSKILVYCCLTHTQLDDVLLLSRLAPSVVCVRDRTRPHAELDLGSAHLAAGNTEPSRTDQRFNTPRNGDTGVVSHPADATSAPPNTTSGAAAATTTAAAATTEVANVAAAAAAAAVAMDVTADCWLVREGGGLFSRVAAQGWPESVSQRLCNLPTSLLSPVSALQGPMGQAHGAANQGDGAGTVVLGSEDALVLDLLDPGKWRPGGDSGGGGLFRSGKVLKDGGGSGVAKAGDDSSGGRVHGMLFTTEGALGANMQERCYAAVRRALVRVVLEMHREWAASGGVAGAFPQTAADAAARSPAIDGTTSVAPDAWDPINRGAWHPNFVSQRLFTIRRADVWSRVGAARRAGCGGCGTQGGRPTSHSSAVTLAGGVCDSTRPSGATPISIVLPPPQPQPQQQQQLSAPAHPPSSSNQDQRVTALATEPPYLGADGDSEIVAQLSGAPRAPRLLKRDQACTSCEPLTTSQLLQHLQRLPWYAGQVAHVQPLPARPATYAEPAVPLSPATQRALAAQGLTRLYSHQAQAVNALRQGANVAVTTSTASGKVREWCGLKAHWCHS
jgi:hypothetical protein